MNIICIPCGPLSVNSYIIFRKGCADAVVIDPADFSTINARLSQLGLRCKDILVTHGHFDHILGVARLAEEHGATVCIHSLDSAALVDDNANLSCSIGLRVRHKCADVTFSDNDLFSACNIDFKVIHTPGHSMGSVCYLIESERVIFTGDTLFRLDVGRTDLMGGDAKELYDSIQYRLFALSGDYRVLPGHMRETTLEFERKHNTFMRDGGY